MPKVPFEVTKESYLLKSTFFYNRLRTDGYFELFLRIQELSAIEGKRLNWDKRKDWKISEEAWDIINNCKIDPMLTFVHPKILQLNPSLLKYYRSVSMLPQKGLKTLSGVTNVDRIEQDKVESGRLATDSLQQLVTTINEVISLIISLSTSISESELKGMMFATAGTYIDGSWRNSIGSEGERVIRTILFRELLANEEVTSVVDKQSRVHEVKEKDEHKSLLDDIANIKTINLINGYSILFSSEPDISMYDDSGAIVGVIEIKAGLDPAGALERLGAMLKSFENTLAEYPKAVTVLVASCITDEVETRIGASMSVRQKYITTEITSSESNQRKFANGIRKILHLIESGKK